jgi:hypothetical protein
MTTLLTEFRKVFVSIFENRIEHIQCRPIFENCSAMLRVMPSKYLLFVFAVRNEYIGDEEINLSFSLRCSICIENNTYHCYL